MYLCYYYKTYTVLVIDDSSALLVLIVHGWVYDLCYILYTNQRLQRMSMKLILLQNLDVWLAARIKLIKIFFIQ